MIQYPLVFREGHYFVDIDGEAWTLDTGAPSSFGSRSPLRFDGKAFDVPESYMGLTARSLSDAIGTATAGLIGTDVLSCFDLLIDTPLLRLVVAEASLELEGDRVHLDDFMGIPIAVVSITGSEHRFFVDTGAQLSYFQDDSLRTFPAAGRVSDFYPGFGTFETDTYSVTADLGNARMQLRCGSLPALLGATLMMAGTTGIVGNEILKGRAILLSPRRQLAVLSPAQPASDGDEG